MVKEGTILVVDDNKHVLTALKLLLRNYFHEVILLNSPNSLLYNIKEYRPDVILLDMNFSSGVNSGNEGLFWLQEVKDLTPETPVILFTAYGDIELAVKALKKGATDFIVKPWNNAKLVEILLASKELKKSRKEVECLRSKKEQSANNINDICWGESKLMLSLYETIKKVAKTNANILITGENGTGKEVVAKQIHILANQLTGPLVTVDMGAIVETLFESELFGHAKGAFTDAKTDRIGKFELAHNGTLFLDEIGNLDITMQAKLLSALQTRSITKVGSNIDIPINIRLIAATNTNLPKAVKEGTFREDLFYRINTIELNVPPLRKRKEDIPLLASFFLNKYTEKYHNRRMHINPEAMDKLKKHTWPGNVRELQHTLEKAVILADSDTLTPEDFKFREESSDIIKEDVLQGLTIQEVERVMIEKALLTHEGNISAIASELGITRPTLYSKIKKYNL